MSSSSDDEWVITTSSSNQQNAAHPYHATLALELLHDAQSTLRQYNGQYASSRFTRQTMRPSSSHSSHKYNNFNRHDQLDSRSHLESQRQRKQQQEWWSKDAAPPPPVSTPPSTKQNYSIKTIYMVPSEYVASLISTYANAKSFDHLKTKLKNTSLDHSIVELLQKCSDPCTWIQSVLKELDQAVTFDEGRYHISTRKFQRSLVQAICRGLQLYCDSLTESTNGMLNQQQQHLDHDDTPDLIVFTDDENDEKERDLIDLSYDDDDNGGEKEYGLVDSPYDTDAYDDDDDDDDDDDPIILDTPMAINQTASSQQQHQQHPLTKQHQVAFINMIQDMRNPAILYFSIDAFCMTPLLAFGGEYQANGTILCQKLLIGGYYVEAMCCIRRLEQDTHFPLDELARSAFGVNLWSYISFYVSQRPFLQRSLLSFINLQLRYNFAGTLGVVDDMDVEDAKASGPPMERVVERPFQKALVECAITQTKRLGISLDKYYFIWLSERHGALRFVTSSRSRQQLVERDYRIDATSNWNGLLELIAAQDTALAKLTIKELVDTKDINGARYFASCFHQEHFLERYQTLGIRERMVGTVTGEVISRCPTSVGKHFNKNRLKAYYCLPRNTDYVMVDGMNGLTSMHRTLLQCKTCGLGAEWLPMVVTGGKQQMALFQLATSDGVVYLLDMKTLLRPENLLLRDKAEHILRELFESKYCLKLAYKFAENMRLLKTCLPSIKDWMIENFKDMKNVPWNCNNNYSPFSDRRKPDGLSNLTMTYLHVAFNPKQNFSNWEKRPLTNAQAVYAACSAYCLLDIYDVLIQRNHPFSTSTPTYSIQISDLPPLE